MYAIKFYVHKQHQSVIDPHNGFILQLFQSNTYNRIASIPTILISAVFHEYVLWAPVRFVLPVLLLMFSSFGGEQVTLY